MNKHAQKLIAKKKAASLFFVVAVCIAALTFPGHAAAISAESEEVITPYAMKEWDDGVNAAIQAEGKGEAYLLSVFADTKNLSEGYYTIYLYDEAVRSITAFDGIRFFIQNTNDAALKINITLTVDEKVSVSLLDTSFAILQSDGADQSETVVPQYGTISIPAQFSGMVYIPFSQLYTPQGEQIQIKRIQSWGIAAVLSQDQEVHFSFGNIAFLKNSLETMKNDHFFIVVKGSETVTIPTVGAITAKYDTDIKDLSGNPVDQNAIFYLDEEIAGATLSADGVLEVSSNCVATQLVICAKIQQAVTIGSITINLQKSGAASGEGEVPTASEIENIMLPVYVKLNQYERVIQIVCVGIALLISIIFLNWVTLAKRNYSKMKMRLSTKNQDTEEDET